MSGVLMRLMSHSLAAKSLDSDATATASLLVKSHR